MNRARYIRWFEEISHRDVPLVGGKNAALGELYRALRPLGVPVPNGFAITAEAYRAALKAKGAWERLEKLLSRLDPDDYEALARTAARAREIVYEAGLPEDVRDEILAAYAALSRSYGEEDLAVAVRSSATAEDLPEASFAGQQDSYLNVQGPTQLLETVRRCFTSLFTDRAIHYRIDHGFDHMKVAISVGVMKMVRSDLASSGVMFTLDTETGFRDVVMITSAYGLGENVVQGQVDPDEFFVHKPTFQAGHRAVLARKLGSKEIKMVCVSGRLRARTQNVPTSPEERNRFSLTDEEVLTLADYALKIEAHFSQAQGRPMPMDIEWAKDGLDGKLYIVQARPETVRARETGAVIERFRLLEKGEVLCEGRAVGTKIAQGKVRIVHHPDEMRAFQPGEVLVAEATAPDWEPVMKKAAAIVTNRGGRTCHAAIVARELGIPAVVGCGDATSKLADGLEVTVSCAEGETGRVYRGRLRFAREEVDVARIAMPKTRIMMNIGHPERAFALQALPNAGVGLARIEFIIAERIRAHPLALLHPEELSEEERAAIERLAANDPDPAAFFVRVLSEGIGQIAAAFWPKPVIVRTSDFKSNEYANLIGGRRFEPEEENPMLGLRGAARYLHPRFQEAFRLECMALKRVRETMGLANVRVMIPFCRTLDEAEAIVDALAEAGLVRGEAGLELYMMCEIPNNVVQIEAFAEYFDGFSIGSNDLTQLVLGVDRDNALLAERFSERNPGVLAMIRQAIEGAHRKGRPISLCGQAPSDDPAFAELLVARGIDAISVNPDAALDVIEVVRRAEAKR